VQRDLEWVCLQNKNMTVSHLPIETIGLTHMKFIKWALEEGAVATETDILQLTQKELFLQLLEGKYICSQGQAGRKRLFLMFFDFFPTIWKVIKVFGYLKEHYQLTRDFAISILFKLSFESTEKLWYRVSKHFWSANSSTQREVTKPFPYLVSWLWIFRNFQTLNVHIHPIWYFLFKEE
jgi:hypothetical protein